MQWLWTWSGKSFGYRLNNELWTYDGRHVGHFVDYTIFDQSGAYLGELAYGTDRLWRKSRTTEKWTPFKPEKKRPRVANKSGKFRKPRHLDYEDFPEPASFT